MSGMGWGTGGTVGGNRAVSGGMWEWVPSNELRAICVVQSRRYYTELKSKTTCIPYGRESVLQLLGNYMINHRSHSIHPDTGRLREQKTDSCEPLLTKLIP